MSKQNKIMVAIDPDPEVRRKILQKMAVEKGFALTNSDAGKLIKPSPYEYSMADAYFILAELHNFRTSPIMNQNLYELAARGMAVMVGAKKVQAEFEFIIEAYYSNYL